MLLLLFINIGYKGGVEIYLLKKTFLKMSFTNILFIRMYLINIS